MKSDVDFLKYAAEIAAKIDPHKTAPNPRVGCVVVREGEIVSEGVHEVFGGGHAEACALEPFSTPSVPTSRDSSPLQGSTVYVTLEPCDCFAGKKTPSCTQKLINLGPEKVVIGSLDPHFGGQNIEKLKEAGIEVEVIEIPECKDLNPFFEKYITTKKPYVCVKMAQSLDGVVGMGNGEWGMGGKYISNEVSRKRVHEMRAAYSAILTTVKTIVADDPKLNVRMGNGEWGMGSNPDIIILGRREDVPEEANIFKIPERKLHFFDTHDLDLVLEEVGKLGIDSVMTECGPTVAGALLEADLVDEVQLFIAPKIVGSGVGWKDDLKFKNLERVEVQSLEDDIGVRFLKRVEAGKASFRH